jgi:hypothetical protein
VEAAKGRTVAFSPSANVLASSAPPPLPHAARATAQTWQAGSLTTAAEAASRITGKTIQAQSMPLSAMIPALKGFGLPDEMAQGLHDLTQTLTAGNGGWDKANRHIQGTTTIETVLRGLMQS